MNNFPNGNPNHYVFLREGSEFLFEVGIVGPGERTEMFVYQSDRKHPEDDVMAGCTPEGAAFILKAKLQEATVLLLNQEHIDRLDKIFSLAGSGRGFPVKDLMEGWDAAMVDSFMGIEVSQASSTGIEHANAMRTAHSSMIPL